MSNPKPMMACPDCGRDDGTHRVYCTGHLVDKIKELKAENTRLRDEMDELRKRITEAEQEKKV